MVLYFGNRTQIDSVIKTTGFVFDLKSKNELLFSSTYRCYQQFKASNG